VPAAPRRTVVRAFATAVVVAAGLAGVIAPSGRGTALPVDETTTTTDGGIPTTITFEPSTTVTTAGPTPTTARAAPTTTTATVPALPAPDDAAAAEGDAPGADHTIPPWAIPIMRAVKRTAPNDTTKLLAALEALDGLGYSSRDSAVIGFGRFPVAGLAHFTDDWLTPRFTPTFHLHEGTDIFSPKNTPVRTPFDGVLTFLDEPVGGVDEFVTLPDKTWLLFAHLASRSPIPSGSTVHAGAVIGYVGNSGDAAGGATHLHFEIHPRGGGAVNPKPILDRWLADALAAVPGLVVELAGSTTPVLFSTGLTRGTAAGDLFAAPTTDTATELLWSAPLSPSGPLAYAADEAARIADTVDWGR